MTNHVAAGIGCHKNYSCLQIRDLRKSACRNLWQPDAEETVLGFLQEAVLLVT